MTTDMACAKTMLKRSDGIIKRRNRGMPKPNIIWVRCITTEMACAETFILARNGSAKHVMAAAVGRILVSDTLHKGRLKTIFQTAFYR